MDMVPMDLYRTRVSTIKPIKDNTMEYYAKNNIKVKIVTKQGGKLRDLGMVLGQGIQANICLLPKPTRRKKVRMYYVPLFRTYID